MASKGRRCLYKGCGHYRKTHACHFHQFPKNPVATERWLASSGITNVTPKRVTSSMYICSCHFHGGFKSIEHPYPLEYIEEYNEDNPQILESMCDDASTRAVMDIPIVFANANEDGLSPASREALRIALHASPEEPPAKKLRLDDLTPSSREALETLATMANPRKTPRKGPSFTPKREMWKARGALARRSPMKLIRRLLDTSHLTETGEELRQSSQDLEPHSELPRQSTMNSSGGDPHVARFTTGSHPSMGSTIPADPDEKVSMPRNRSIGIQCQRSFLCYDKCKLQPEEEFTFFTGINQTCFEIVYDLLGGDQVCHSLKYEYKSTPKRQLSEVDLTARDKLFMTLLRLRRGIPLRDLGKLFGVSEGWASKIFYTWLRVMSIQFSYLDNAMFLSAASQEKDKPKCFEEFNNLRCIIDAFEFKIQKPKHLKQQSNTWSSYKHANTGKMLVAVSCYGGLSFISDAYEGNISDRKLMLKCGFLDHLIEGDVIMADRGFDCEDLLNDLKVDLIIPAFMKGRKTFYARELIGSKMISSARIHVEGFIGRVREFRLARFGLENTQLAYASDIFKVCAYLVNFHAPYIRWDSD